METYPSDLTECGKGHGPNWLKWLGHLAGKQANGLELGTFQGESAEWMLDHIFTHPDSRYTCVDTFAGSPEHHLAGIDCENLERDTRRRLERFGDRVIIFKGLSSSIRQWPSLVPPLDFIYVDAAHDAMNVMRDATFAWDLLKVDGVMVFDDYPWTVFPDAVDCPKLAIDSFVKCYARQLLIIGLGWQMAVRKTREG